MEIVLIATLVALCWAVRRSSAETDRLRKPYAARHLLGPLPEADRSCPGDAIDRALRKAGNPTWVRSAGTPRCTAGFNAARDDLEAGNGLCHHANSRRAAHPSN